jgi:hypothetical protein
MKEASRMAHDPRPIETSYGGCRFRSRLEARWAVFFDHMHLRWEYEPEGYRLPNGDIYLPDFLLPDLDVSGMALGLFVEVKPDRREHHSWHPGDLPKCSGLATEEIPVLLAVGYPDDCRGYLFGPGTGVAGQGCNGLCLDGWASSGCMLMPLPGGSVGLVGSCGPPKDCRCALWPASSPIRSHVEVKDGVAYVVVDRTRDDLETEAHARFEAACKAFKSARFEHGESG